MKLYIENFQSITNAVLDFPQGAITTIIGPSNSGKTSCIRALYSLIKNPSESKSFIQNGKKETSVTLIHGDMPKIRWSRTLKDTKYEIKDLELQKTGRTDLTELLPETHGLCLDDEDDIINIQDEWSPLFPFGRNAFQTYKLFENVFAINPASEVLQKIKQDESETKKELISLQDKHKNNTVKLNKINEFLSCNDLDYMKHSHEKLKSDYTFLNDIKKDNDKLIINLNDFKKLRDIKKDEFDLGIIDECSNTLKDFNYVENNIGLLDINLDSDFKYNFEVLTEYSEIDKEFNFVKDNISILDIEIKINPEFNFDTLTSYSEICKDLNQMKILLTNLKSEEDIIKNNNAELLKLQKEYDSIDVCPLCNQNINKKES